MRKIKTADGSGWQIEYGILSKKEVMTLTHGYADKIKYEGQYPTWRLRGDAKALLSDKYTRIAIVGTRDIRDKERQKVFQIVSDLKASCINPVIISGLAFGTDEAAHSAALAAGIPTYAILPTGLDAIYPKIHKGLAERMAAAGGGVLTYFPDGTEPQAINFIMRNTAIALAADILIVPFSKAKGGAMVTARLAKSYGLELIYAVPGDDGAPNSRGCNDLIREGTAKPLPTSPIEAKDISRAGLVRSAAVEQLINDYFFKHYAAITDASRDTRDIVTDIARHFISIGIELAEKK